MKWRHLPEFPVTLMYTFTFLFRVEKVCPQSLNGSGKKDMEGEKCGQEEGQLNDCGSASTSAEGDERWLDLWSVSLRDE